jgi:hypothetical protein
MWNVGHASAGGSVNILVFMEHGIGSASAAQPYVDKLVEHAKSLNGWDSAEGKYVTKRSQAKKYISDKSPQYGFVTLGAFLGMRKDNGLEVVGVAEVDAAGGRKYHIISKDSKDLAGCKGKKLASNHLNDKKYIEKVVADGAFSLADFEIVKTKRPVETIKKVSSGDAVCALIDNAQLTEMAHIEGTSGIKSVWASAELPPTAVVAFSSAPAAERAKFKSNLGSLCSGAGKVHCDKVGIKSIRSADESVYKSVIGKYDN